jgi:hypothetical protein
MAVAAEFLFLALLPFIDSVWRQRGRNLPLSKLHLGQSTAVDLGALGIAILTLLAILFAKYRRERLLGAVALLFLFLSLWDLMTGVASDKFFWFSGAFVLIASASALSRVAYRSRFIVPLIAAFGLVVADAYILGQPGSQVSRKHTSALKELISVLTQPHYEQWRYVTIGLGAERFGLARHLRSGSLDTSLPWLLPPEELKGTRYYSIDELPLGDESAVNVLGKVLSNADQHALRWVITADDRASPLLEQRGYALRSAWKGGVVLWSKDSVPAVQQVVHVQTLSAILWGIIPPMSLLASLILMLLMRVDFLQDSARRALPALELAGQYDAIENF